jgi:hypothetical protein
MLGCGVLMVSLTIGPADAATTIKSRSHLKPAVSPAQTENQIKLLGYGLFLLHIGLKPFESARQGDRKLSQRLLAEAAPPTQPNGQRQSIE